MKLMTKNKAMELLGIGRTALENMLKAGQLKCVPVGNTYRIPDFRFCAEIVQKWGFFTPPPSGNLPTYLIRQ